MAKKVCIVGGGAAGFFAAIHCKENAPDAEVILIEKTRELLAKVVISGGGRCNVTHACFDPRKLSSYYPRGHKELMGPFHQWNTTHTIEWFSDRGVETKTESDGRMFPITDKSETIMNCLLTEAERLGVEIQTLTSLKEATWEESSSKFKLTMNDDSERECDALMLATGGNRQSGGLHLAESFGHNIIEPVPSLFTFHIEDPLLDGLSGLSVAHVETSVAGTKLIQDGPLLITHWGTSGPATLKLSAWGAREIAERNYKFTFKINWLPKLKGPSVEELIQVYRQQNGARLVHKNNPFPEIPKRLWGRFCELAEVGEDVIWSQLPKKSLHKLVEYLHNTQLQVTGKSMNKEEFVTCGGVTLKEINMKKMESRLQPGLFFAGEIIDIDGVTGGFNFQAAWTGGYIAGISLADHINKI